jgi:hypothetical protein
MSTGGKLPGGFGPPPDDSESKPSAGGPPAGDYGPPVGGYGPPPGGYGAAPTANPPSRTPAAPPAPAAAPPTPIAQYAAVQSQPFAAGGVSKKVGWGVVSLAAIGIRVLLVAGRSSSTPNYAPPPSMVDFGGAFNHGSAQPLNGATAARKVVVRSTLAASKQSGEVYWSSGSTIHHRTAAGAEDVHPTGTNVTQLSAFGDRVCWAAERDEVNEIVCAKGAALASAKTMQTTDASCTALFLDASDVYALQTLPADSLLGAAAPNQVTQINLLNGLAHQVLHTRIGTQFAIADGFAYWISLPESGRDSTILAHANLRSGGRGTIAQLKSIPDLVVVDNKDVLLSFGGENIGFGSISRIPIVGGLLTQLKIPGDVEATAMQTRDVLPDQLLPMRTSILARYGGKLAQIPRSGQKPAARELPSDVTDVQLTKGGIVYTTNDSSEPLFLALE